MYLALTDVPLMLPAKAMPKAQRPSALPFFISPLEEEEGCAVKDWEGPPETSTRPRYGGTAVGSRNVLQVRSSTKLPMLPLRNKPVDLVVEGEDVQLARDVLGEGRYAEGRVCDLELFHNAVPVVPECPDLAAAEIAIDVGPV